MDGLSGLLPRLPHEKVLAYLQHLGVTQLNHGGVDLPNPTISLLREMQQLHHDKIPFETVSIHLGRDKTYQDSNSIPYQEGKGNIDIQPDALFDKIVTRGMGGYCFELNGLFAMVLRTLGYRITNVSARVFTRQGKTIEDGGFSWGSLTHQSTLVHFSDDEVSDEDDIPADWKPRVGTDRATFHCDVGFGAGQPRDPILLNTETATHRHVYERLPPNDEREEMPFGYTLYRKLYDYRGEITGENKPFTWVPMYHYTENRQLPIDYITSSWFSNTWPNTIFVKLLVATVPFASLRGDAPGSHGRHSLIFSHDEALGARKEGDTNVAVYQRKGTGEGNVQINEERIVSTFGELKKVLWDVFGIDTNKITPN